jgi:hypothetical protein
VLAMRRGSDGMTPAQFTSKPGTRQVREDPAEASGSSSSRGTSNRYYTLGAHILQTASHWEVWIFRRGQPLHCAGSVGLALASDALRQGQNLVDDLLNDTLKQLERYSHLSVCASVRRQGEQRRHAGPTSVGPSRDHSPIAARRIVPKQMSTSLNVR